MSQPARRMVGVRLREPLVEKLDAYCEEKRHRRSEVVELSLEAYLSEYAVPVAVIDDPRQGTLFPVPPGAMPDAH